jgi:hypothetical protein
MDLEKHKLEADLGVLKPAALDGALTERLMAAIHGRAGETGAELAPLAARLGAMKPVALSPEFADRLLGAVEHVPFRADEKLVLFPGVAKERQEAGRRRPWFAAAAAVAMAGALSALWMSPEKQETAAAKPERVESEPVAAGSAGHFMPANFGSDIRDTTDLGVRWNGDARPVRLVRVTYQDRMHLQNEKGEEVVVTVPRVEYVVLPEEVE